MEENEQRRKVVRNILQVEGYRTPETETSQAGLQRAPAPRPVPIRVDRQLPARAGSEARGRLRAGPRTRGVPNIAGTASARTFNREQILPAACDGDPTKPIGVKAVLEAVCQVRARRPGAAS